jgi:hypothetical protein
LRLSDLLPGRSGGDGSVPLLDDRALQRGTGPSGPAPAQPATTKGAPGGRRPSAPAAPLPKPSAMQSPEDRVGYVVAALLFAGGIAFALTTQAGKHPSIGFPLGGSALAVGLAVITWRYRNRFLSGMTAVVAALLVNTAKPAVSLVFLFYLVLVGPLAWAIWLTLRQSKAARAVQATQPRQTPEQRRADREARKARKRGEEPPAPARPAPEPNRRYTPPQPGRQRKSRKEIAANAAKRAKPAKASTPAKTGSSAGDTATAKGNGLGRKRAARR